MNMILVKTCNACPEQYDVYNESGLDQIGYIRFRFGQLEVHPTGMYDEVLWETNLLDKSINDDYLGVIPDELRDDWLNEAKQKLEEYYENRRL